jgi:hypothetical protein
VLRKAIISSDSDLSFSESFASNLQTIEVLELFDMEKASRRESIEKVCECWTELDGLPEDQAFSNLRLLFRSFGNWLDTTLHRDLCSDFSPLRYLNHAS